MFTSAILQYVHSIKIIQYCFGEKKLTSKKNLCFQNYDKLPAEFSFVLKPIKSWYNNDILETETLIPIPLIHPFTSHFT
jgi:hypothetical protein